MSFENHRRRVVRDFHSLELQAAVMMHNKAKILEVVFFFFFRPEELFYFLRACFSTLGSSDFSGSSYNHNM